MARRKAYEKMTTAELAVATAEYNKPWTGRGLPGKALTARQHRRGCARAKARRTSD